MQNIFFLSNLSYECSEVLNSEGGRIEVGLLYSFGVENVRHGIDEC